MRDKGTRAWPYRRITGGIVKPESWVMDRDSKSEREVPGSLPDWDYQTNLHLSRRLSIDSAECRSAADLMPGVPLALSVRWAVRPSLLRGSAAWIPLHDHTLDYVIDVTLAGERLGGVVRLETQLVLAAQAEPRRAVAHLAGSSLWNDAIEIRLQGDAPLFPIALIPFSGSSLPDRAAWYLELGADLHAAAMGAMQLLVNQEHLTVAAAISQASSPSEVDRAILSILRTDVIRTMLDRALTDEGFEMTESFEEESLGAVLQGLFRTFLSQYLIDDDLIEVRRIRTADPAQFTTIVQAATEMLGGPR